MSKVIDDNAASSTATTPEQPTPSFAERSAKWTPEQRQKWDLTGHEPETSSPQIKEEETPATTDKTEASKTAPESGPDKTNKEPSEFNRRLSRRDRKIGELSAENRRLQRELAAKHAVPPNASQPTRTDPARPLQRPKRPSLSDPNFDTVEKYEAAMDKYETDLDVYNEAKIAAKHGEFEAQREKKQVEREVDEEFVDIQRDWHKACAEERKVTKDFDQSFKAVSEATQSANAGHIDTFILESPFGTKIVHYLARNADAFNELLELSPTRAIARLGLIEHHFEKAPIAKKTSSAPDPPEKLGGKDEKVDGPKPGSRAWMDAENARDVVRFGIR